MGVNNLLDCCYCFAPGGGGCGGVSPLNGTARSVREENKSSTTYEKPNRIRSLHDQITPSYEVAAFLLLSSHPLFKKKRKEFSSSITELRPFSEKDNRGSNKPLVACQCCTVRLSFTRQSKLVRPYQTVGLKGNGNDLFK